MESPMQTMRPHVHCRNSASSRGTSLPAKRFSHKSANVTLSFIGTVNDLCARAAASSSENLGKSGNWYILSIFSNTNQKTRPDLSLECRKERPLPRTTLNMPVSLGLSSPRVGLETPYIHMYSAVMAARSQ